MRHKLDRLWHVGAAAAVWLWAGALIGLWLRVFEPSGPSLGITAAAGLGAFALGLAVPGQFLRAARVMKRLYPRKPLAMPPVGPAGPETPRQVSQLLGVALIVAAGGSLLSAMCLWAGSSAVSLLRAGSLLPAPLALVVQLLVQLIAMMGWGAGAALVWQAQSLARGGGKRPAAGAAREHEDWLWGLAAAGGITAFTWQMAWDPVLVGLLAGAAQVSSGVLLVRWPRSLRALAPVIPKRTSPPPARVRLGVLACAAIITLVATFQFRGLVDLLGATLPQQALFATVSIALLAAFHRRWASRRHKRSAAATAGTAVVVTTAVGMQLILGWVSLAGGADARWVLYVALMAQLPLAAALGLLTATQRQHFLSAGGSTRHWEQWSLVGQAVGAATGAAILTAPFHLITAVPVALLIGIAGAIVGGIAAFKRTGRQLTWTAAGGVLLLAMTLALATSAVRATRRGQLSISGGQWLTAWQQADRFGYLPVPDGGDPEWELDLLLGQILARRGPGASEPEGANEDVAPSLTRLLPRGRWLAVCRRPWIDEGRIDLQVQLAAADPAIAELPLWHGRKVLSIWRALQGGPFQYHGVFYGPMRADHPSARVVYRSAALRQAAKRVARGGGMLILHVPCAGPNAAPLLAVARTAEETFGPAVAVVRVGAAGAEILLFCRPNGSGSRAGRQELTQSLRAHFAGKAFVLDSTRLAPLWADVPTVNRLAGPECGAGRSVPLEELRARCVEAGR